MMYASFLPFIRSRLSSLRGAFSPMQEAMSTELCSCSYSVSAISRPTVPTGSSTLRWTPTSRLPTISPSGPATLKYPFPIEYMKDREMILHDMARRPQSVLQLSGALFNVPVRIDILHRCVRYLRAKWQQGTHKAKTRGEVSGGRRKPRPQKKTGRSRQGSIRSPIWKGGGANFGPRPRSHAHKLPRNVQLLGMKCALSARCNEGRIVVVDSLASVQRRPVGTRAMKPMITALMRGAGRTAGGGAAASGSSPAEASGPACRTALLVDCGVFGEDGGNALRKAAETISGVEVMGVDDVTVYHVLKYNVLVISKPALDRLSDQLASPRHRKRISARQRWWERELKEFAKAKEELCAS